MDLENVSTHDARTTQSDQDASIDMSYDDVCVISWKGNKAGKGAGKKGPNGAGTWYRGKVADEWRVAKETTEERREARKAPRAANLIGTVTKTKDPMGTKAQGTAKVKARAKLDIGTVAESTGTSK